jgi:hypothetical protein
MNRRTVLLWTGIIIISLGVGLAMGFLGASMTKKVCVCPSSKEKFGGQPFIDVQNEGDHSFLFKEELVNKKKHLKGHHHTQ